MARFIPSTVVFVLLASATGAMGQPPKPQPSTKVLQQGVQAIAQSTITQAQGEKPAPKAQPGDVDQGDEHASDRAILVVCNHDNPSARRAAICPQPNSPP